VAAPAITLNNICLAYQQQRVLSDLNLHMRGGKWTALLGTSGVGKSSLLRLMSGLTTSDEHFAGSLLADNNKPLTAQIAWMGQTDLLLPWLSVLNNVLLGYRLRGITPAAQKSRAIDLLNQVGLGHALDYFPHQLSGGMRQRAALARTLMEDKPIVLMDEPFSALDAITRHRLHELATDLLRDKTVLFVTHDPLEALRLADDIYILHAAPRSVEQVATLTSPAPREIGDAQVMKLYGEMMNALGDQK
jgi:putative hydroxymethylpyrimidine transport system ATP-binding protein